MEAEGQMFKAILSYTASFKVVQTLTSKKKKKIKIKRRDQKDVSAVKSTCCWVWFSAPTWQFTTVPPVLGYSILCPQVPDAHIHMSIHTYIHTDRQTDRQIFIYIYNFLIKGKTGQNLNSS